MAAGMSTDADPARLTDRLGARWALAETSFKFHASCRHTHPAADALLDVMTREGLRADQVARVTARVHKGALDVLGPVVDPQTVHQSKFSMGTVLALIALHGRAALADFDRDFRDPAVIAFRDKVAMELDAEVDSAYPARWIGKVTVETTDGRRFDSRVDVPKGDPDNTLTRAELEDKAIRLGTYRDGASEAELRAVIARVWSLRDTAKVGRLLQAA
jgi:2-methylcitrate dehydratase PrpD